MIFTQNSGLNDSIFGKSQAPIRALLEKRGEYWENNSMADKLFNMAKSTNWAEKSVSMTNMQNGWQPVGENGPHPVDEMQEGFSKTIEHMVWKNSFMISREAVDDAKLIDFKQRPQAFVDSYYRTRENFAAALYGAAATGNSTVTFAGKSFDTTGADGKALFDKAHPAAAKGKAQSNMFSNAFSADALGMVESEMQNFRGDTGEILTVAPDTIIIPNSHALKKAVFEAVGADRDPNTSNNGFNYQFGRWNIIVWQGLNDYLKNGQWILLDSNYLKDYGAAMWFNRVEMEVTSSLDRNTNANIWDGYARFGAGFVDWRYVAIGGAIGGTELS